MVIYNLRAATHHAGGRTCTIRPDSSIGKMQRANAAGTKLLGANTNIFFDTSDVAFRSALELHRAHSVHGDLSQSGYL